MKNFILILAVICTLFSTSEMTANAVPPKKPTKTVPVKKNLTKKPTTPKVDKLPMGVEIFEVSTEAVPCENNALKTCFLVKRNNQKEFEIFNETIEGFNFEEGNSYILWVKKEMKSPPINVDESVYKYVLYKMISKKDANGKAIVTAVEETPKPKIMDKNTTTRLIINEEQGHCDGIPENYCLLIKKPNDKDFEIFYQNIPGFKFERGYRQTILVHERHVDNPLVKQTVPIYTLIKVEKKEKIFDVPAVTETPPLLPVTAESACPFDKKWYLTKMKPNDTTSFEIEDKTIWVNVDYSNKKVNGKAPCNNFMGGFSSDLKTTFATDQLISTKMYCENMNLEDMFLSLLQNVDAYKLSDDHLDLYKGKSLLLSFVR